MHHKLLTGLTIILVIIGVLLWMPSTSYSESLKAEEKSDYIPVIVQARLLNGRASPSKKAEVLAFFDKNDILQATGEWSEDHHWIEVVGGEMGCVWVYADYVNEVDYSFRVWNIDYKQVKIRSRPIDGKITGYLKRDRSIEITQVVMGWGKCSKGWIDLNYVEDMI